MTAAGLSEPGMTHRVWPLLMCGSFAIVLVSCSSPSAAAPTPAVVVVTPVAPTSVPVAAPPLPPTPALIATPGPTPAAGSTVNVPTAPTTSVLPAPAASTPGTASVVGFVAELPASAGAIPAVEVRNPIQDPGLTRPSEVQFELAEPISTSDALRRLVEDVVAVAGVVAVKSDGVHLLVQYDDSRVQPAQLRQGMAELGHAAAPGTDVSPPGKAAD